jgi:hypothetical protein
MELGTNIKIVELDYNPIGSISLCHHHQKYIIDHPFTILYIYIVDDIYLYYCFCETLNTLYYKVCRISTRR